MFYESITERFLPVKNVFILMVKLPLLARLHLVLLYTNVNLFEVVLKNMLPSVRELFTLHILFELPGTIIKTMVT